MSGFDLLKDRVLNKAFAERGLGNVVLVDSFPIRNGESIRLHFESTNSPWRQGVWMGVDGELLVNRQSCKGVELWHDIAPSQVDLRCETKSDRMFLYNIWDSGRGFGSESQSHSSGMLVEDLYDGRRYRCNDIGFETKFDKLVFRVQRLGNA